METNFSISFIMPNLLIGLCKKSKWLRPYASIFHDQLGYEFFRLELPIKLSIGRTVTPDAIVYSNKTGNTLIFEWTEAIDPINKQDQFSRYTKINSDDLSLNAGVPPKGSRTVEIVLSLRADAVIQFQKDLSSTGKSFPILALYQGDETISLTKSANSFVLPDTDKFFTEGIQTNRLPRYLPFSLEQCHIKELIPFVIQQLVSYLVKGETHISLPDFCRDYMPAWDFIGNVKKKEISDVTKGLINDLYLKKFARELIKRNGDNPPSWDLYPDAFKKNSKGFRKQFNDFICEVRGDTYQLSFNFESGQV